MVLHSVVTNERVEINFSPMADTSSSKPTTDVSKEEESTILKEVLLLLEEFGISDQFYHELSMIFPTLPRLYKVKHLRKAIGDSVHDYNIWDKQVKKVKTEVMKFKLIVFIEILRLLNFSSSLSMSVCARNCQSICIAVQYFHIIRRLPTPVFGAYRPYLITYDPSLISDQVCSYI